MGWGFLDWVRGRPFRPDPDAPSFWKRPSERALRSMLMRLLDDGQAYDASKLLGDHRGRARPMLEALLRDDPRFRSMEGDVPGWTRPRYDVVLTILFEWDSEVAVEEAKQLALSADPRHRAIAAHLLAETGQARFADVLVRLAQDPDARVRTELGHGLSDVMEYGDLHGKRLDDALVVTLYDFMRACALRTDRGPGNGFAAVLLRVEPEKARRDFDPEVVLTADRNWLRDLVETLRDARIDIPAARVRALLAESIAVFDREGFAEADHPGHARTVAALLCLLADREPAAAEEWARVLRSHREKEARRAAQEAREQLSSDPVKVALMAHEAAGGVNGMRREHRAVYLVWLMDAEVLNGGWLQWVANTYADAIRQTEAALREVGAAAAADEVAKVMEALGPDGSSPEQGRRMAAIDRMMDAGRALPDDGVIWKMSTDLRALLYDYADRHRDAFPRAGPGHDDFGRMP